MQKSRLEDIESLVSQFQESSWQEMRLTFGEVELFLSKDADASFDPPSAREPGPPAAAPAAARAVLSEAAPSPVAESPASDVPEGSVVVRAPSLGTFYRAPKPGAPTFCDEGDVVTDDSELCLIEVMKLFTTVRAKACGIVRKIYVNDGEMVEFDQPLFLIEPHA